MRIIETQNLISTETNNVLVNYLKDKHSKGKRHGKEFGYEDDGSDDDDDNDDGGRKRGRETNLVKD